MRDLGGYGRARGSRPIGASSATSGQQRRSGIIAATWPAVRVRIMSSIPISKVGIAGANRTEAAGGPSTTSLQEPARGRRCSNSQVHRTRLLLLVLAVLGATGCAEVESPTASASIEASPAAAEAVVVICTPGSIEVTTPVVRAHADGVHFVFENQGERAEYSLHHETWARRTSEGGVLPSGRSEGRSSIAPGRVWVACVPDAPGDDTDDTASGGWITIVDPDDLYVPFDLSCGWGDQFRIRMDAGDDAEPMDVFRRIPGVRPEDELVPPLYPRSPQYGPTAIVFRDGEAVARIMSFGTWRLLVNACPGSGISGAGR